MDLVRLAYYPYHPQVKDAVRELGPDVADLVSDPVHAGVRRRAVERIEGALADRRFPAADIRNERDGLAEILAGGVARMLLVLLGERTLVRRYAEAEGTRLDATLAGDPSSIPEAAQHLGLAVDGPPWTMHFADFLAIAPHDPEWKLIHQPISKGRLPLTDAQLRVLCGRTWASRLESHIDAELARPVAKELRAALQPYLDELGPKLAEAKENWTTGDFGPVQDTLFPPCIRKIFDDMAAGVMVTHHARFAMASFLATVGMTADDILDYFRKIPNFDPDKSRYQITHIAGEQGVEKYTPPGCATMQTNGICPLEQRDGLCFKIKHPLSYYRARIRFQKQDGEKAGKILEHEKRKKQALADAEAASG